MSHLFKLNHLYNRGNQDIFFRSSENIELIKKKLCFIEFRAEEIISSEISLSTRELADILFNNIEAKEVPGYTDSKTDTLTLNNNVIHLDSYFIREELCSLANDIEKEMVSLFNLKELDISIKNTDDAKYYLKEKNIS